MDDLYEVEYGVKGAVRIVKRGFASLGAALESAERWSRSNSIGSYWSAVSGPKGQIKSFNL